MSTAAGPWVLPWIAFFAAWMSLCSATFALHRLIGRHLLAIPAAERSALLLALAVLPITVAALVALLGFTPSLGGVLIDHHCHVDKGCGAHVPILYAGAPYPLTVCALLFVTMLVLCGRVLRRLRHTQRVAGALAVLAEPAPLAPCRIVDSSVPFAYCIGLWRPKVVISKGLERTLSREELDAVVAHEHAHAARRDNLRHGLAALSLLPLDPRGRRALLADLTLASEEACDRAAIGPTGSSAALLGAFAAIQRGGRVLATRATSSGATTALVSRLAALERGRFEAYSHYVVPAAVIGAYAAAALVTAFVAHHGAEMLLGWLGWLG